MSYCLYIIDITSIILYNHYDYMIVYVDDTVYICLHVDTPCAHSENKSYVKGHMLLGDFNMFDARNFWMFSLG